MKREYTMSFAPRSPYSVAPLRREWARRRAVPLLIEISLVEFFDFARKVARSRERRYSGSLKRLKVA